jgi:hypothetical protein
MVTTCTTWFSVTKLCPLNRNAACFLYSTNWNFEYCLHEQEACGLEIREYGYRDPWRWPHGTLCPQKLALTLLTGGGCLVSIVHLWTQATEFWKGPLSGSKQFMMRKACSLQVASHKWHISVCVFWNRQKENSKDSSRSSLIWMCSHASFVFAVCSFLKMNPKGKP